MADPKYENIGSVEDKLIEECSELIQAVCKGNRFGWKTSHPNRPESNNFKELLSEFDDVKKAFDNLVKKIDPI